MPEHTAENGRPLGAASGGEPGFWERLGTDDAGMPAHLPIGVNANGQGPEDDSAAYAFTCWCGDPECPLSLALGHAWASGRRVTPSVENDAPERCPYDGQTLAWHLYSEPGTNGAPRTNAAFIGCQWPAELDGLAGVTPPAEPGA